MEELACFQYSLNDKNSNYREQTKHDLKYFGVIPFRGLYIIMMIRNLLNRFLIQSLMTACGEGGGGGVVGLL